MLCDESAIALRVTREYACDVLQLIEINSAHVHSNCPHNVRTLCNAAEWKHSATPNRINVLVCLWVLFSVNCLLLRLYTSCVCTLRIEVVMLRSL